MGGSSHHRPFWALSLILPPQSPELSYLQLAKIVPLLVHEANHNQLLGSSFYPTPEIKTKNSHVNGFFKTLTTQVCLTHRP